MDYQIGQARLFTGIPLPEDIKKKASEIFKGRLPIPYVNVTNLHITLNFFGDIDSEQAEKVKQIFSRVCSGKKSFAIEFDKIIAHNNRQIHMTVKNNPSLANLQADLEKSFEKEGFAFQDRQYYPHVKLANMHMDNVMYRERKIENFPNQELGQLNFKAEKVVLFQSKLLLHHAHHTPLIEVKLNES